MENYQKWEQSVLKELHKLKAEVDDNDVARSLYNGFYIWDGIVPTTLSPDVLFIGINPGNGDPNNTQTVKLSTTAQQITYIEYIDGENPTYALARETLMVFEKAGYSRAEFKKLLQTKALKTNFYYIITNKQSSISRCLKALDPKRFGDFWGNSYHWTERLIRVLKPKVVICEGKSVYNEILAMNQPLLTLNHWENHCGYFEAGPEYPIVIGYSRKFSRILNKEGLAELIRRFVPKD